ncbi:hypothetical protein [Aureimonas phyllosphaerae]|uniref:Uncharacterized protein n=1 Tax=Aureimonas phyllosphaerae TaxID=1166078 RepID=A0A7W6BZX4_9HYPH|nr:hypothetical protein [Aureimonas phyllosphaerae]MBB3938278.1 hypothetical protein [Aureimonas phyllosphaerae]MBB3962285.1 hypothetical protein [Aureimonas phyllosphaerae]SFF57669.1 hypothetical protein SAMN05216566_1349 [Aureimonas phyllosphaerae]
MPGAFTSGTNDFAHAGSPDDGDVAQAYERAYPDGFADQVCEALAGTVPDRADPAAIGRAVADVVSRPPGWRPLQIHVDPASDGAVVTFAVTDRVREQFLDRIGLLPLLRPAQSPAA